VSYYLSERFNERRYNINTVGLISPEELGLPVDGCQEYTPVPYAALRTVFAHLPHDGVFVDIGSGKGRALVYAAAFPFRKVIGVEYSSEMVAAARQNIEQAQKTKRLQCQDLSVVQADAREFVFPADTRVVYIYNTVRGEMLQTLIGRLRQALKNGPLVIAYFNFGEFEQRTRGCNWLRQLRSWHFFPGISGAIYEAVEPALFGQCPSLLPTEEAGLAIPQRPGTGV
jgi:SAM-dependent methyltransferase